jgi:hypothetical protein
MIPLLVPVVFDVEGTPAPHWSLATSLTRDATPPLIRQFAPLNAARWCMEQVIFLCCTQAKAIYSRLKAEPVRRPNTLDLVLAKQRL